MKTVREKKRKRRESPLAAIVFGAIRHARLQRRRELMTHFRLADSGRKVDVEFPSDLAAPEITGADDVTTYDSTAESAVIQQSRRRQIVLNQIREFTSVPKYVELIERRLFRGEPFGSLSEQLSIHSDNATSIVRRCKQYLGLIE